MEYRLKILTKKLHIKKRYIKSEFLFCVNGECVRTMVDFTNIGRPNMQIEEYGFIRDANKKQTELYWQWYSLVSRIIASIRAYGMPNDIRVFCNNIDRQDLISKQEQLNACILIVQNLNSYIQQHRELLEEIQK